MIGVTAVDLAALVRAACAVASVGDSTFLTPTPGGNRAMTVYTPSLFAAVRTSLGVPLETMLAEWPASHFDGRLSLGAGRSGSLFLKSASGRFLLKTISPKEATTLQSISRVYTQYATQYPSSTIFRIVVFFSIQLPSLIPAVPPSVVYVVCMANVAWRRDGRVARELYDLKGRVPKRPRVHQQHTPSAVYKDKDLARTFPIAATLRATLLAQIAADVDFLGRAGLMDYSLLIAVFPAPPPRALPPAPESGDPAAAEEEGGAGVGEPSEDLAPPGGGEGMRTGCGEELQIGIIDALTLYSKRKVAAHCFKRLRWSAVTLSTVPPERYGERFLRFMTSVVVPIHVLPRAPLASACRSAGCVPWLVPAAAGGELDGDEPARGEEAEGPA